MARKRKHSGIEWVGGLVSMPAYVTGEGEPYRPEALFWLDADGLIVGQLSGRPGEVLGMAAGHLRSTIAQPLAGRSGRPARVRVASPDLARALRAEHAGMAIVCAPTPEIDEMFAALREYLGDEGGSDASYLTPGIAPEAVAALFRAAAVLYRVQPWKIVPNDQSLISVTIDALDVHEAVLLVIGQMQEHLGVILFDSRDDYELFVDAADDIEQGDSPNLPPHMALNFERGAELDAALRKEIAQHRWEVAGANAYPSLIAIDADLVARPLTLRDYATAEAIALALPALLEKKKPLLAAFEGGAAIERTIPVHTVAGEVQVTLRAPFDPPGRFAPPFDLMAAFARLDARDGAPDHDLRRELQEELVRRFVYSPEAAVLPGAQFCMLIMEIAAAFFDMTVASLGPTQLRHIVFDDIPRKAAIGADAADAIVAECRAFYAFLDREFGLPQARACLRLFGRGAAGRLRAALSDSGNFGLMKSLFAEAVDEGLDLDSVDVIESFLAPGRPGAGARAPFDAPPRPAKRAGTHAKKAKKKSRRKAPAKKR
ncbi:MAG: hypothetical protein AB7Q97_19860 [Gammaproteobacteria bacterium]